MSQHHRPSPLKDEVHVFGEDVAPRWLVALDPSVIGVAASKGDLEEINELVCSGADPRGVNQHGQTPLLLACKSPNEQRVCVIQRLLELGSNVNRCDSDHCSPLLAATMWGDVAVVQLLLSQGASIDHQNMLGYTALHAAAQVEQPRLVSMLLRSKASVDIQTCAPICASGEPLKPLRATAHCLAPPCHLL